MVRRPPRIRNESERIRALERYHILDTPPEEPFDQLVQLASAICETPMAFLSFIDADRQWFKSRIGLEATETSREASFCGHAITAPGLFVVPDSLNDPRFERNPLVIGEPFIRFYSSMPLNTFEGVRIGTLAVADRVPRELSDVQKQTIRVLANEVVAHLELRRKVFELERADRTLQQSERRYRQIVETAEEGVWIIDAESRTTFVNGKMAEMLGYTVGEMHGRSFFDFMDCDARKAAEGNIERGKRGAREHQDFQFCQKDGKGFWALVATGPIMDAEGKYAGALFMISDITERKLAEERFRKLVEHSSDAIAVIDAGGKIQYSGPSTERILGYKDAELVGRNAIDLIHPDDLGRGARAVASLQGRPGATSTTEFRAQRRDGSWCWVEASGTNLLHEPSIEGFVANYADISERKDAQGRIWYQAYHDPLTDLPNRMLFHDRLTLAIANAQRHNRSLAVLFIDADHFKLINDTLGHSIGDVLLKAMAVRLQSFVRAGDTVARIGGDEFTILLQDVSRIENVALVADKILDMMTQVYEIEGQRLYVNVSIGVAVFPADGDSTETLLKNADNAMSRAKEAGRNMVQLYTGSMNTRYAARLAMESQMRQALERNEFVLFYQPVYDRPSRLICAFEALIRWNHPTRGLVPPDEFIQIAEETRMIIPIGEWVLKQACEQTKAWQQNGSPAIRIAVNLSARQLQRGDFVQTVDRVLAETGLDPECLELEITESVAMHSAELTMRILGELKSRKIRIAVDDFGTGQTSLIYLTRFPIDTVKIDRVFVRDVLTDSGDAAIVAAVIGLSHSLRLKVVAEGVETIGQLGFLDENACDRVQGYLFSRPVPADQAFLLLSQGPTAC